MYTKIISKGKTVYPLCIKAITAYTKHWFGYCEVEEVFQILFSCCLGDNYLESFHVQILVLFTSRNWLSMQTVINLKIQDAVLLVYFLLRTLHLSCVM